MSYIPFNSGFSTPPTSRFHRTAQSDILTAAIKILTDNIIEERKSACYVHLSALFDNELDLSTWLNKIDKVKRDAVYNEWYYTRKPDINRIRNSIVIRHLNDDTTNADVFTICSRIGTVLDVYKPRNDKGFVFVDFEDSLSIGIAIRELHKVKVNGELITVELSKTSFTSRNDLTKPTGSTSPSSATTPKSRSLSPVGIESKCLFN